MSVFNSVGTPLVVLMVILIIAGSIFGMAVSGADIFNPAQSAAEANRINSETEHQKEIYKQAERLMEEETNAQVAALQLDQTVAEQEAQVAIEYEKDYNEKKLAIVDMFIQSVDELLFILAIGLSIAFIVVAGLVFAPKAIVTLRKPSTNSAKVSVEVPIYPADPWKSKEFRKQMIKRARQNEGVLRAAKLNQQIMNQSFYKTGSKPKDDWNRLPWAN